MSTFLTAQGRKIDRSEPDGNCLFRSLSKQLCDDPECHRMLRKIVTEYVESNAELFTGWTVQRLPVTEHARRMRMQGTWGSHLEIKAIATLFKKTIYVVSNTLVAGKCKWEAFSPFVASGKIPYMPEFKVKNQKSWLEIAYTGQSHYDGVVPLILEMTLRPPALTGQTYSMPGVL